MEIVCLVSSWLAYPMIKPFPRELDEIMQALSKDWKLFFVTQITLQNVTLSGSEGSRFRR